MTATIDTEILTKSGWKSPDKITPKELGLSLCKKQHVWTPMSINIDHYNGELISFNCKSFNAQLVPTSKILCRIRKYNGLSDLQNISIQKLGGYQIAVPVVSDSKTICSLSEDQIRLAGWLMTDGCFSTRESSPCWTIYQSKPSDEIERILESNNLQFSTYIRNRNIKSICGTILKKIPLPQKSFRINTASTRSILHWAPKNIKNTLPKWAFSLSNNQFDILLSALISGDGSKYKNRECYILYGKHQLLSNIQYIALTHGWRANISVAREKDFRLNLCRKRGAEFKPKQAISKKLYNGLVWSATTNTKNLLVRRQGVAYFLPTN